MILTNNNNMITFEPNIINYIMNMQYCKQRNIMVV